MYILLALGFAFLFSIMGILNFAHGVIYMVSAFLCLKFTLLLGLNPWLALLCTLIIVAIFGVLLERFIFRRFYGDMNGTIVACLGIIAVLQNSVVITEGYVVEKIPEFARGFMRIGTFSVSWERMVTLAVGVGLLILVLLFINKTKQGLQMQAIAQDTEGAIFQGISIHGIAALACIIAFSLAAVSGSLMGSYLSFSPYMGDNITMKILQILVLGGIGSINGILYAGLILGTLDASLPIFVNAAAAQAIVLFVIVIILLFRPKGLFGREV
jgi:branched-chain amino acid transport system permease protein